MKKNFFKAAIASSIVLASGCASIINDKEQSVNIVTSNGKTVEGTVRGLPFTAPGQINLDRSRRDVRVLPASDDCQPTDIESEISPWFWGNVITGGLAGSGTDAVTEKMWEYDETITIICK